MRQVVCTSTRPGWLFIFCWDEHSLAQLTGGRATRLLLGIQNTGVRCLSEWDCWVKRAPVLRLWSSTKPAGMEPVTTGFWWLSSCWQIMMGDVISALSLPRHHSAPLFPFVGMINRLEHYGLHILGSDWVYHYFEYSIWPQSVIIHRQFILFYAAPNCKCQPVYRSFCLH